MIYTHKELAKIQSDWYDNLSDDVKHEMFLCNDIPFEDMILSLTDDDDIININNYNSTFQVIKYQKGIVDCV